MKSPKVLTLLALLAAAPAAQGETLAQCRAIGSAIERLDCYDAIDLRTDAVGLEGAVPGAVSGAVSGALDDLGIDGDETSPAGRGAWVVQDETDPMTDTPRITMMLTSTGSGYRKPALFVRCASQDGRRAGVEVFISWKDYLADNSRVTVRFDDNTPITSDWSMSTDSTATFSRIAPTFVQLLANHDQLVARITPYNEGPVTAVFPLAGFGEASSTLRAACDLELH